MEIIKLIIYLLFPPLKNEKRAVEDGADVPSYDDVKETPVDVVDEIIPPPITKQSHYTWIIDCGHGGLTRGKRSPMLPEGGQLLEWQFTGSIGKMLSQKLVDLNIDHVIIPENQENRGNDLKYRVDFANNYKTDKPKIFISIHGNAGPVSNPKTDWSKNFSGIEVWHYTPSQKSKQLAQIFQTHLVGELRWRNRGIKSKTSGQFYVLRKTNMPACLLEIGFYNNLRECRLMLKEEVRQQMAKAILNGILYIENSKEI